MTVSLNYLSRMMHETYEKAAIKNGWYPNTHERMSWALIPEDNKAAIREAVSAVEDAVREDERSKYSEELIQTDLTEIMQALGMNTHARSYTPHEVVQKEILPNVRKMKKILDDVRAALGKHYVEAKKILDEGRNLV